jgi:hypothetical protein
MYFIGSEVKNEGRGRPRLCSSLHRPLDLHWHRVRLILDTSPVGRDGQCMRTPTHSRPVLGFRGIFLTPTYRRRLG